MSSWQSAVTSFTLRHTFKRKLAKADRPLDARAVLNSGRFQTPDDVEIKSSNVNGIPGEWVRSRSGTNCLTLLYLHGGGYIACSSETHRVVTAYFAQQGFSVFVPNYRLAPEHPFPAAVDDAQAAYVGLLASGIAPSRLVLAGDSAGGGLCLALLLRLRDTQRSLPAASALFSPLTDLAATGASLDINDRRCGMFHGYMIQRGAQWYLNGANPRDPLASPLYAELGGLPPMLIHVGADEVLRDDSTRLAERARAAGASVDLRIWPSVPHCWQLFHRVLPEGRESLAIAAGFLRRAAAFRAPSPDREAVLPDTDQPDLEVAVIGAGFSGLGMAIRLKEAGFHAFILLEKARQVGGTWRDNTYPGCACDVPSHLYSYSYERNPKWSRMYSNQPEIHDYLKGCVEKYDLAPYIRLDAELREAVYDETRQYWKIRTSDGRSITARVLVSAMGALHRPFYPALPGIDRFKGAVFHSAEWRHDYDLKGKRIAVIGTGASAVQFVPEITPKVRQLTLFQRTPAWVLPKSDRPIGSHEQAIYRRVPVLMGMMRNLLYWRYELRALLFVNPGLMRFPQKMARKHLEEQVGDPVLREKLTPDYTIGCKRILISNDYFPALTQSHVEVVTYRIAEVREHSIVTASGTEHAADAIIYSTGFQVTDMLGPVRIVGRCGAVLNDIWRDDPQAYFGIATAGFPNLFLLLGPNTGLGHNSVVFMAEQQIGYVIQCLRRMRNRKIASMEIKPEAQKRFNEKIQLRLQKTVWATGCKSWYQNSRGRNVTLWPGFTFEYWSKMKNVRFDDFLFSEPDDRAV